MIPRDVRGLWLVWLVYRGCFRCEKFMAVESKEIEGKMKGKRILEGIVIVDVVAKMRESIVHYD